MPSLVEDLTGTTLPATESNEAEPETASTDNAAEAEPQAQVADGTSADQTQDAATDDPLTALAKAEGFNLEDPNQRKWAEKLLSLQPKEPNAVEELTEFERQAFQPAAAQAPAQDQNQPPQDRQPANQRQAGPTRFDDIGDSWKGPEDAFQAEAQAWSDVQSAIEAKQDPARAMKHLNEIRVAQFRRQVDSELVPYLKQLIPHMAKAEAQKLFQQQFGAVIPEIESSLTERRESTARQSAVEDLKKTKGFENVEEMYKPQEGTLQWRNARGQFEAVPNTPLNQILVKNPEILNITVSTHPVTGAPLDPATASRATYTARLRAAMRYHNAQRIPSKTAQSLVDAGTAQAKRASEDRTRQTLNAGSGSGKTGTGPKGLVGDLQSIPGSGESFASSFK